MVQKSCNGLNKGKSLTAIVRGKAIRYHSFDCNCQNQMCCSHKSELAGLQSCGCSSANLFLFVILSQRHDMFLTSQLMFGQLLLLFDDSGTIFKIASQSLSCLVWGKNKVAAILYRSFDPLIQQSQNIIKIEVMGLFFRG